ncbi:MAG: LPP20 family lipoprotein [Chitinophagaceae bacterium]|nr:LPP20 family lipoprotein [Chitinophagaceae bacterium]
MKQLILIVTLVLSINAYAQDDKTVTLVASGQGKTQDEAKQNALRSAIEQAFGTFISSKTEILNDSLVKDEIVSVANGNIQKFEIISEVQIPNGVFATSLKATVSVTKLTSFVESKGVDVEFKGGLFALNIQNQELSAKNEITCLNNLKQTLMNFSASSFDYEIKVFDPTLSKSSNLLYNVPIKISCRANINLKNWVFLLQKTIIELAMPKEEVNNYMQLSKSSFAFQINGKNPQILHFRNEESLKVLNEIFAHLVYGIQNFEVRNDIEVFSLSKFKTRERDWYTSNEQSEIQQREQNYLMLEFNYRNLGRYGPNVFDGCYPCIYDKDLFYLINRGYANRDVSMKNEISFVEILNLVDKVVAIYEFNDVLNLDDLKKISKYEVKRKIQN